MSEAVQQEPRVLPYVMAINEGVREVLKEQDNSFVAGEDVAAAEDAGVVLSARRRLDVGGGDDHPVLGRRREEAQRHVADRRRAQRLEELGDVGDQGGCERLLCQPRPLRDDCGRDAVGGARRRAPRDRRAGECDRLAELLLHVRQPADVARRVFV